MSSGGLVEFVAGWPGNVFFVVEVTAQAAVQDADEPIAHGAQGLMMGGAACAADVVVAAGSRGCLERGKGLQVKRIDGAAVANMASENGAGLARLASDRTGPRVVPARLGSVVPVWRVIELSQHPGRQNRPKPGLAQIDLSVRVPAKPASTCSRSICS